MGFSHILVMRVVLYVEIKCQLDATEVFIADLTACSTCFGHHYAHHQKLKSIIQWLLPVVFRAVVFKLLVWCGAEGCEACVLCTHASQVTICSHNTDNVLYSLYVSTFNQVCNF